MEKSMEKSKVSFRIGLQQWLNDQALSELYGFFTQHLDIIDEVAFFDSRTHCPLPLEVSRQRMAMLKDIMARFRSLGMTAGINVLATIGHHDENLENSLDMPWQKLVGPDGTECKGCYCPSDERVREYIEKIYESAARAEPDFIWMDDDIRSWGHMPILCSCFCDRCLAQFSSESSEQFTRQSLIDAFADDSLERKLQVRKKWLEHNRKLLDETVACAERAVHGVSEKIIIGLMSHEKFLEGYDFVRWMDTLRGRTDSSPMSRPGGGFWDDITPSDMMTKAHAIGRQVSMMPAHVIDLQSEVETFPHQKLNKSVHITILEAAIYLAAGSTGSAYSIMPFGGGALDECLPFAERIRATRSFCDLLVSKFQRADCEGLWFAWNKDIFASTRLNGLWFDGSGKFHDCDDGGEKVYEIGIAPAYSADAAKVAAFPANSPRAFSRDELKGFLAGGVWLDGPALKHFLDMGLGEYVGFNLAGQREDDSIEVLSDHPLNDGFAGEKRDCRQSFKWWWAETAYVIEPATDKAEILAYMEDYSGKHCGPSMGVFQNSLGGRVAVSGYFPWKMIHNRAKSSQIKAVARWLSADTMPAIVRSFEKVNLWTRRAANGEYGALLLNSSFDAIDKLEVCLLTDTDRIDVYDMDCQNRTVQASGRCGKYGIFEIHDIGPWTAVLATGW